MVNDKKDKLNSTQNSCRGQPKQDLKAGSTIDLYRKSVKSDQNHQNPSQAISTTLLKDFKTTTNSAKSRKVPKSIKINQNRLTPSPMILLKRFETSTNSEKFRKLPNRLKIDQNLKILLIPTHENFTSQN